jgi:hypothetical protein
MDRRDVLKGMTLVAGTIAAQTAATGQAGAQVVTGGAGGGNALVPITPPVPDYFIPNRFAGRTFIVTGCARGMGAAAAKRLSREGANIVGVDWIGDLGAAVIAGINAEGGKAVFINRLLKKSSLDAV